MSKLRLSEKEFKKLVSNKKLNIVKTPNKTDKISLSKENSNEKTKRKQTTTYDIIKQNQEAKITTSISNEHFSVIFEGARLLSINQIFALLQNKKYEIFKYKKSWHNIITKVLSDTYWDLKSQKKDMPFFDSQVEITIFRQAPRLVDEDALTTMFKYIIDAFKKTETNSFGILEEDNPKIVSKIESYSEKGEYCVGIRIKVIQNGTETTYTKEDILENK